MSVKVPTASRSRFTRLATGLCCIAISVATLPGCTGTAKTGAEKSGPAKTGTAPTDAAKAGRLTGTVTYRARIALTPEAVITVRLEDTSRQDVASTLIAEYTDTARGRQVPIPFTVSYDPARIEAGHTYTVRASIHEGERLVFTTTSANPVINNGVTSDLALDMEMVGASHSKITREDLEEASDRDSMSALQDSTRATASLENTYWKAVRLGGHDIVVPEGTREAHFVLHTEDHRVAGTGGCNQFSGSYVARGDSLAFRALASTMMACAEPAMTREKWLTDALSQAKTWRITGEQLELLRDGAVIGTFVSVYLK